MKAILILHQQEVLLAGKYMVILKVYEVGKSKAFPDGIKAKFILKNIEEGNARLLVDNHQPYGFHMHTRLPHDRHHRELLDTRDYKVALDIFMNEVRRIIRNEET